MELRTIMFHQVDFFYIDSNCTKICKKKTQLTHQSSLQEKIIFSTKIFYGLYSLRCSSLTIAIGCTKLKITENVLKFFARNLMCAMNKGKDIKGW